MTSQHSIHSLWLFLVVLGYMLLIWLLWFLCWVLQSEILLCYPPFGGSWMGSPHADVHVMCSLLVLLPLSQCASCPALLGLLEVHVLVIPLSISISVTGCAGICLYNVLSSCSSGRWQGALSLAGQDAAGVGNAGPNPRHQTSALGQQAGPVCSLTHGSSTLLQFFRSVGILCIFFINTCFK